MDPKVKEQWVAALRSGKYKQGKGLLHNLEDDSWCCLGVLCDLAVRDGLNLEVATGPSEWENAAAYNGRTALLPREVMDWAGLLDATFNLVALNDTGASFAQIADVIERNL